MIEAYFRHDPSNDDGCRVLQQMQDVVPRPPLDPGGRRNRHICIGVWRREG
jgi:hypothetical protein